MASNPKDKVYLTGTQLNTLANGGSIASGSDTYTADETALYLLDDTSVLFEAQTLTSAQQSQARTNIGAGTSNFSGSYNDLTDKPTIPSIAGLESTSNKVTSLSSSSTDTQYPSAKCVYDLIGDVETLLGGI